MDSVQVLLVLVAVAILVPFLAWHWRRSRELAENWAKENAYAISEIERRYLRAGPFFWRRSRGHEVFHVVVRDARGQRRAAYVRTGGWFLGQFSDQVTVEWDEGYS
jgi:hypothetical protein